MPDCKELDSLLAQIQHTPAAGLESLANLVYDKGLSRDIYNRIEAIAPGTLKSIDPAMLTLLPSKSKQRVALEDMHTALKYGGGALGGLGVIFLLFKAYKWLSNRSSSDSGGSAGSAASDKADKVEKAAEAAADAAESVASVTSEATSEHVEHIDGANLTVELKKHMQAQIADSVTKALSAHTTVNDGIWIHALGEFCHHHEKGINAATFDTIVKRITSSKLYHKNPFGQMLAWYIAARNHPVPIRAALDEILKLRDNKEIPHGLENILVVLNDGFHHLQKLTEVKPEADAIMQWADELAAIVEKAKAAEEAIGSTMKLYTTMTKDPNAIYNKYISFWYGDVPRIHGDNVVNPDDPAVLSYIVDRLANERDPFGADESTRKLAHDMIAVGELTDKLNALVEHYDISKLETYVHDESLKLAGPVADVIKDNARTLMQLIRSTRVITHAINSYLDASIQASTLYVDAKAHYVKAARRYGKLLDGAGVEHPSALTKLYSWAKSIIGVGGPSTSIPHHKLPDGAKNVTTIDHH